MRTALAIGLAVTGLAAGSGGAQAQSLTVDARATGGWDSNPTFAASPENRGGLSVSPVSPDGLGRLAVRALGRVGELRWASATLDGELTVYGRGEVRAWERARIAGGLELGAVALRASLWGARYDVTDASDDAWAGGARAGLALESGVLALGVEGVVGARAYDAGGQVDRVAGGRLFVELVGGGLGARASLDLERRDSNDSDVDRTEVAPGLGVRLAHGPVELDLEYTLYVRRFDAASRDGVEHVGRFGASFAVLPWLSIVAEVEGGIAVADTNGLRYERLGATGGVAGTFAIRRGAPPGRDAGTAVTAVSSGVRLRFTLPGATRVELVGELTGWRPLRMRAIGSGTFEVVVRPPPGRYAFHLLVDGVARTPPGVDRTVPDDFGSRNAVLVVGPDGRPVP